MKAVSHRKALALGLLGSAVVWAGDSGAAQAGAAQAGAAQAGVAAPDAASPQEPVGFITGGIIGAFAAGPVGAVVGAGIGTWLGNRVHRAGEATQAEIKVAALEADKRVLQSEKDVLQGQKSVLLSQREPVDTAANTAAAGDPAAGDPAAGEMAARDEAALALDGLQGDVLFRTGSADVAADTVQGLKVLADMVARSPLLTVRIDGYADSRGGTALNLELSKLRANAVRDVLVAAGVGGEALEINAYGKSRSVAQDADGYALERRVRLTLLAKSAGAVARTEVPAQIE